jgi:tol-pal system protein YbgF
MRKFVLLLSACTLAYSGPAFGQSKKELAAQNAALAERITVLESRLLTGDPAAERLIQRIDALETSQRTLTGEVERLRFERDNLRAEVSALSGDIRELEEIATRAQIHLDAVDLAAKTPPVQAPITYGGDPSYTGTVGGYSGGYSGVYSGAGTSYSGNIGTGSVGGFDPYAGQPSTIPSAPTFKEIPNPAESNYAALVQLTTDGKQKLAEGNFAGAQSDFSQYLTALPDAPDAGEINFWLGETHFVQSAYTDAASAYIASMKAEPDGSKAPDAMVRLAATLRELGKTREACQTLDSFSTQYPNAPAATRAKVRTELARTGC